jgi:tetratricopeptide (TPR) repeat protein
MALCCVQHSAGEANYLHLKFVTEAHLSVGRLFGSDLVAVQQHLEAAQSALDALCALAGDGERWIRKTSELRFQCFLACSQILYDLGGDHKMMAHSFAKRAKELLPSVAELGADLGLFCYNCGVREHKAKQLESCVAWVQLSVDSFDRVQNVHNLCRSLRLLAASLMDMRQLEQAKKTAHLAMELDHGTAHTLAMLCRIHLAADETQVLEAALSRLLQVPDLTLTAGVDLCQELRSRGSLSLCAWALRQLADRFSHDPSLGLLCVEQLRLAVQTDREAALVLMNGFASKHHDGTVRLSAPVCSEMVRVCFDLGVKHRESATAWIGLAVSLAGSSSLENDGRAQLHRLLATVCLEANDVLSALSNAKSAVQLCSTAAAGYYLLARCLMIKDAKETSHALVQLASCKDFSPNMMFNLAAIAQSLGCTAVMIDALERFVSVVDVQSAAGLRDFVAASRALVRALGSVVPSGDFVDAARIVSTIFCKCREGFKKILFLLLFSLTFFFFFF